MPSWASGPFLAVTRTDQELSIVCVDKDLPKAVERDAPWRALRVVGPLDFSEIGILAGLSSALAAASLSIFVISTYLTDILLVREE